MKEVNMYWRLAMQVMVLGLWSSFVRAEPYTLEKYLQEVAAKDPGVQASQLAEQGAGLSSEAGELVTGLRFFTNASYMDDERPTQNPGFQGFRTEYRLLSLGLQQQSELGMKWSLSQNVSKTLIEGAGPQAVPLPDFFDVYPKLELSIPLWKNWLGSETRAEKRQAQSGSHIAKLGSQLELSRKMAEIESAYWALVVAKDLYTIQQDSLQRAQKLLAWAQARSQKNLGELSDVYQMQAAVQVRQIEFENSKISLADAARRFNSFRGIESAEVSEELQGRDLDLAQLSLSEAQVRRRIDHLISQNNLELQQSQMISQREKVKPQLDLNFSYSQIGRDREYPEAQKDLNYDYWLVSLNFNMPLDQFLAHRLNEGYGKQAEARELSLRREQMDQQLTWKKTIDQGQQLKKQVALLKELESIQKKKVEEERRKLNQGRSTTFQVLNFEQDYYNARAQRISVEFAARQFLANLRMFVD